MKVASMFALIMHEMRGGLTRAGGFHKFEKIAVLLTVAFFAMACFSQTKGSPTTSPVKLQLDAWEGIPQTFTLRFINTSDRDVRIPAPNTKCDDSMSGELRVYVQFTPTRPVREKPGIGYGCVADTFNWPPITDRIKAWQLLRSGESFKVQVPLDETDKKLLGSKEPGTFNVRAEYHPPGVSESERATLSRQGIDVPATPLRTAIHFQKR
jgi:hypothetical protein